MASASPTRLRSRNESFPIRNERANQTFSCCTISKSRERRRLNGPCIYVYVSAESLFLSPCCLPFCCLAHLFSLVLSSRFLRSLLCTFFCYPFFVNIFLSARKHLIGKIPPIDFNYSFTTDTKENF